MLMQVGEACKTVALLSLQPMEAIEQSMTLSPQWRGSLLNKRVYSSGDNVDVSIWIPLFGDIRFQGRCCF